MLSNDFFHRVVARSVVVALVCNRHSRRSVINRVFCRLCLWLTRRRYLATALGYAGAVVVDTVTFLSSTTSLVLIRLDGTIGQHEHNV